MSLPTDLIFRKTEKGVLELRHRTHGLNARVRQVLILLDGHRRVGDLCRMLPEAELNQPLASLEGEHFIARDGAPAAPVQSQTLAHSPGAAPALSVVPAPAQRPAWQDGHEPLPVLRARLVRALLDATGPSGDDMAVRIERCLTLDEVRSLVDPAAAIVEAVGGRHACARFLERIGRLAP